MSLPREQVFTVSTSAIFKMIAVIVAVAFVYLIRDVVVVVLAALFLAALIDPFADWFERKRIPRSIAVLVIYVLLLGLLGVLAALLIPPLRHDIPQLIENLSDIWARIGREVLNIQSLAVERGFVSDVQQNIDFLGEGIDQFLAGAFSTIRGAIGFMAGFVITLVMAFYMVVEESALKSFVRDLAPRRVHSYLSEHLTHVQKKIGSWLRGQLLLSAIIGIMVYVALLLLGVRAALALAIFAALAEFVPYIGPIFAAIPAIALAFADTPLKGVLTALAYVVIQQLENNLLVPKVMQRAIGLNPIVSIISLLIGARIGGIIGALFAIPLATAIAVFVTDYLEHRTAPTET